MSKLTEKEDEWQRKATDAAIAGARKIVTLNGASVPAMTAVGRLSDPQWGWIVTAAIFGWIKTRCEQAVAERYLLARTIRAEGDRRVARDHTHE